jgi:hypothetical protein
MWTFNVYAECNTSTNVDMSEKIKDIEARLKCLVDANQNLAKHVDILEHNPQPNFISVSNWNAEEQQDVSGCMNKSNNLLKQLGWESIKKTERIAQFAKKGYTTHIDCRYHRIITAGPDPDEAFSTVKTLYGLLFEN